MPSTPTPPAAAPLPPVRDSPRPGAIDAFICGYRQSPRHVRHPHKDSGYEAINAFSFMASADEWFGQIVAEVGPDGNLWVADWYNFIIQHNPTPNKAAPGMMRKTARETPTSIPIATVNTAATAGPSRSRPQTANAQGDYRPYQRARSRQSVLAPHRPAAARRAAAPDAVPALRKLKTGGHAALHSLWALEGLGKLDRETHRTALIATDPARAATPCARSAQSIVMNCLRQRRPRRQGSAAFNIGVVAKERRMQDRFVAHATAHQYQDEWLRAALAATGRGVECDRVQAQRQHAAQCLV